GEDGRTPARGRLRPGREALARVRLGHAAAVAQRRHRRRHAGVHPDRGRIRHSGAAGRRQHPHDRSRHVDGILQQYRLAHGGRSHLRHGAAAARAAGPVPAQPGTPAGATMMRHNRLLYWLVLILGFAFLYIPIISLVVYSFNESTLVTVWSGFSLKWYQSLFNDQALLSAAWLSLRIAALTATAAVIIGTWAGFVLAR